MAPTGGSSSSMAAMLAAMRRASASPREWMPMNASCLDAAVAFAYFVGDADERPAHLFGGHDQRFFDLLTHFRRFRSAVVPVGGQASSNSFCAAGRAFRSLSSRAFVQKSSRRREPDASYSVRLQERFQLVGGVDDGAFKRPALFVLVQQLLIPPAEGAHRREGARRQLPPLSSL